MCWPLSSPDGSYTEEQNSETQVKATVNPVPTSSTPEFDDEFDDEETLPTIGTCKALYPFEGDNSHERNKSVHVTTFLNIPENADRS